MRSGLLLIILISFLSTSAAAANYSCRDSNGKLYFTDNLAAVPSDCRQNLKQIYLNNPAVNNASSPAANNAQTKQTEAAPKPAGQNVASDTQAEQLMSRAATAAKKFSQGAGIMDEAGKRRRYGSKARFAVTQKMADQANQLISEARQEKEQLREELKSQPLTPQQSADIVKLLNSIK